MHRKGGFSGLINICEDGTITLPKHLRSRLGLEPHDHLFFQLKDGHIVASKVKDKNREYYVNTKEQEKNK
ncbi:MAG: AbrB/MazE/SpoVT family DNA-binding domain-containing protein [Firmicutes bacterium]|jgi:bifunctional DNA-binding transcriptional regulator/antitoxin component of YhaV-PrlF toxin-antitoxin module|nr:AbrB/MazE/SpoVT family DNA-binding domain-containing protein [Bacillota bacterium]